MTLGLPNYLESKISPEPNSGCWLWTGALSTKGYANAHTPRTQKSEVVHRVIFERLKHPIPHGLQIDHKCRVRCCVNPDHMEPVTLQENIKRGETGIVNRTRMVCSQGHSLADACEWNGKRRCRTCHRERERARRKGKI